MLFLPLRQPRDKLPKDEAEPSQPSKLSGGPVLSLGGVEANAASNETGWRHTPRLALMHRKAWRAGGRALALGTFHKDHRKHIMTAMRNLPW